MSVKIHPAGCRCESCLEYDEAAKDARLASEDAREPRYDEQRGEFVCECGAGDRAFIQHPDDEHRLVCASCGERYDTPKEGPWTFTEAALPSPSGPDAETLAETVRESVAAALYERAMSERRTFSRTPEKFNGRGWYDEPYVPPFTGESRPTNWRDGWRDEAREVLEGLSGLVALVEQRERERDAAREASDKALSEYEKAEALLARYRQALEDTGRIAISVGLGAPTRYIEIAKIARDALAASVPGTEKPA